MNALEDTVRFDSLVPARHFQTISLLFISVLLICGCVVSCGRSHCHNHLSMSTDDPLKGTLVRGLKRLSRRSLHSRFPSISGRSDLHGTAFSLAFIAIRFDMINSSLSRMSCTEEKHAMLLYQRRICRSIGTLLHVVALVVFH